ncbi:hypothetical protein TNCV_3081041 [Trichonephila clavipes]|nr:hypothetical protein TNCV_3081041 [Trichonephila clavipes]
MHREAVGGGPPHPRREARQNTRIQHEKWAKYYNKRRGEVNIEVNDLVLVQMHPISSVSKKVVAKFKPKFEDQVRIYHQRKSDEGVVDMDSSVSSGSEYQSNSLEFFFSRPRLDPSQGFRSSELSEKQVEKREKTNVSGNKSGRREQ